MKATLLHAASAVIVTASIAALDAQAAQPAPEVQGMNAPAPVVSEERYRNYLDAPQTSGTWIYVEEPGEKMAIYGPENGRELFLIRCADDGIALARVTRSAKGSPRAMSVTTETVTRQFNAEPVPSRPEILAAFLAVDDPLLDAMAITKGRVAIEVEGQPTLYLPAWVEISRVIEQCR